MKSFLGISQIFATLLFNFSPVQASTPLSKSPSKAMPMQFHEVWGRSLCRSLERMVEVEQEYPATVEYVFSPGCVLLHRCSGCCSDENLECYPTLTHNVTMQLLRITPSEKTRSYVDLSFVEHDACECRPRRSFLTNKSGRRLGGDQGGEKTGREGETVASAFILAVSSWALSLPSQRLRPSPSPWAARVSSPSHQPACTMPTATS